MRQPVLVLSGGAARGAAHLGFLAAMENTGLHPKAIVGTSAGALMGALYTSWDCTTAGPWERVRKTGYGRILRFAFSRRGIFSSAHLASLIGEALGKTAFEELPVPLLAATTNWTDRTLELLGSGDLAEAVAASCALPPLFTPVRRNGADYLDGGVLSILPAMAARRAFPEDLLIAVDVNARSPRGPVSLAGEGGKSRRPLRENWISMAIEPLWLSIARASLLERTFADFTLPLPGGDYPLFSLSSIEKIYALGYHEGKAFFDRRDIREAIYGDREADPHRTGAGRADQRI
ncbi:MAG: patatin-like phospholipase family protein [Nitrospirae bacterium]|nr:patatin-like phospholipase family protein [Nitrospirota bacterium]MCL5284935.1 patatin-like phospholipase family protein [Nitrospirota bacterium]